MNETPAVKRAPARESVVIDHFWRTPIVFHQRNDPGTSCRPNRWRPACGHAMPITVALKIAKPCAKCWPNGVQS